MKPTDRDELWEKLEVLRDRPVVTESREYARRWGAARERAAAVQHFLLGPRGALLAAGVAACLIFVMRPITFVPPQQWLETRVGERRVALLPDGSRITLNTDSHLRVTFSAQNRDIYLLEGQARFEVAKNPQRPFRVHVGSTEVIAVGTVFDVAALPAQTTVTLIEGRVDVRTAPLKADHSEPAMEALTAGQQLKIAPDGHVVSKKIAKIESVTAWQRGSINLDDVPVDEALAEINRYSSVKISIADPALSSMKVSGVFRTGDTEAAVAALERYFDLKAVRSSGESIVLEAR